jgi:hypothetical protein
MGSWIIKQKHQPQQTQRETRSYSSLLLDQHNYFELQQSGQQFAGFWELKNKQLKLFFSRNQQLDSLSFTLHQVKANQISFTSAHPLYQSSHFIKDSFQKTTVSLPNSKSAKKNHLCKKWQLVSFKTNKTIKKPQHNYIIIRRDHTLISFKKGVKDIIHWNLIEQNSHFALYDPRNFDKSPLKKLKIRKLNQNAMILENESQNLLKFVAVSK